MGLSVLSLAFFIQTLGYCLILPYSGKDRIIIIMNIRSITLLEESDINIELASRFFSEAGDAFHLPVQTVRIALTPFPILVQGDWVGRV